MSRILENTHADAEALFRDGLLDAVTMRALDGLRLPPMPSHTAEDVQRIR